MKWKSHQAVTAATVYAATGDVLAAILAMQGSIWPDAVEMKLPFLRHRALSHWWPVYVLPMTLCYFLVLSKLGFFPDPWMATKFILSGGFSFPLVLGELFLVAPRGAPPYPGGCPLRVYPDHAAGSALEVLPSLLRRFAKGNYLRHGLRRPGPYRGPFRSSLMSGTP